MMKIAIPITENRQLNSHFGQCDFYGVYTISENNEIMETETIKSEQGCGCKSNIADILAEKGVSVMLSGGIGQGAINVLNESGIKVIRGCSGDATDIVKQYIEGKISDSGISCLTHEHHHGQNHGHNCGH